jgi:hypothetical protein
MKKHYILLSLKEPNFSNGKTKPDKWATLLIELEDKANAISDVVTLAESDRERAWLIPRNTGLNFAAECIHRAQEYYDTPLKTWFLDEET